MRKNFEVYKELINTGRFRLDNGSLIDGSTLWDLVIITAINEQQKNCYECQIEAKLLHKKLPDVFKYLVINDPNGCKIGSGGSTLNVLKKLLNLYQESLFEKKILLIHAGGYSQRMPSCTILGKIFSPVSSGHSSINDILDVKLATYTPFSLHMQPGVFLLSSDDIITCDFGEQIESGRLLGGVNGYEFLFLAHRSSLNVGKDHGVYAPNELLKILDSNFKVYDTKFVLQKPSVEKMRCEKVVLMDERTNEEYVLSDSSFYFTHTISKLLLELDEFCFERIAENNIEIDAYRDFLQPLGTSPMSLNNFLLGLKIQPQNTIQLNIFTEIYYKLTGRKSLILALTESSFYHLGTLNELFYYYFNDSFDSDDFRKQICFTREKLSSGKNVQNSCVLFSKINGNLRVKSESILEYFYLGEEFELILNGSNLVSNCMLKMDELKSNVRFTFEIPQNVCVHTISIKVNDEVRYVTIFYAKNDDLKKVYSSHDELIWMGKKLKRNLSEATTVWSLKIFKSFRTMSESFVYSLAFIESYFSEKENEFEQFFDLNGKKEELYSLFDLLKLQNFDAMISFRLENQLI